MGKLLQAHVASGASLYSGALLLLVGAVLLAQTKGRYPRFAGRLVALFGISGITLSATPLPMWLWAVWGVATVAWVVLERRQTRPTDGDSNDTEPGAPVPQWWRRPVWHARLALAAVTLVLLAAELPWRFTPALPDHRADSIVVIGDSLAAGINRRGEGVIWPHLLEQRFGVPVLNLARPAEQVGDALVHVEAVPASSRPLVLIEVGGNDQVLGTPLGEFEADLARLLDRLQRPGRLVVLVEFPLLPFFNRYGEVQRRLARERDISMLPKHLLASALGWPGHTIDGLHFSAEGHKSFASAIGDAIAPAIGSRAAVGD